MTTLSEKIAKLTFDKDENIVVNDAFLDYLEDRYAVPAVPPCRLCGGELSIQRIGGGSPTVYACTNVTFTTRDRHDEGWQHYSDSSYTQFRSGDSDVITLINAYREASK
jgi:hypothetical protein